MKKNVIRLGVIGAGNITQTRHLPGFRTLPKVELVAVCNRSLESSARVAKQWEFERIARTPLEIIHAPDIDAVVIGAWPCFHHTWSCAALKAGKHVFTQARMARNLAEAKRMLAVARKHPKQVAMICPSPYALKSTLFVQNLLKKGYVGSIRLVQFYTLNSIFADPKKPIHWRQQRSLNGMNTLSLGIFLERFLQWFGPIHSVQAMDATFTSFRPDEKGRRIKVSNADQIQILGRLQNHPGHLNLIFSGAVHHAPSDQVWIYGEKGTLRVDFTRDRVDGAKAREKKMKPFKIPLRFQRSWTFEADFVDAIRAGGRHHLSKERTQFFPPDFKEGVRYMAATEAVIRAARTGREEQMPY